MRLPKATEKEEKEYLILKNAVHFADLQKTTEHLSSSLCMSQRYYRRPVTQLTKYLKPLFPIQNSVTSLLFRDVIELMKDPVPSGSFHLFYSTLLNH